MPEPETDRSELSFAEAGPIPELQAPPADPAAAQDLRVANELLGQATVTESSFTNAAALARAPSATVSDEEGAGFAWNELPLVLSHFDLGVLKRIESFRRGSRQAPKAVIVSDQGAFLVKRREHTPELQQRMTVAHKVQKLLLQHRYPAPPLMGTRRSGSTMVVRKQWIYEVFHFVVGDPYDRSAEEAYVAGRALGLMQVILRPVPTSIELPSGSFHASPLLPKAMSRAGDMLVRQLGVADAAGAIGMLQEVGRKLAQASRAADDLGIGAGAPQVTHGDWHPGNLIFNKQRQIIGVIDYDTLRLQHPLLDAANGALQFSAIGGADPTRWTEHLDLARYQAFMQGYAQETDLGAAELQAVPWLMVEALGMEVLLPLAARGAFGGIRGDTMLGVVRRQMDWLINNAQKLSRVLEPDFAG